MPAYCQQFVFFAIWNTAHSLFHQYVLGHYLLLSTLLNMGYLLFSLLFHYSSHYWIILICLVWCAFYLLFIITVYWLCNCRNSIFANKAKLYCQSIYFLSNFSLFISRFLSYADLIYVWCKASGAGSRKYWSNSASALQTLWHPGYDENIFIYGHLLTRTT